mmetsp:Transcript_101249/g.275176  ORF Transcript_101249/g.275176 Transcript_101249/m.275176 type:complete len:225 (-) Transcript_101249:167-841(-)
MFHGRHCHQARRCRRRLRCCRGLWQPTQRRDASDAGAHGGVPSANATSGPALPSRGGSWLPAEPGVRAAADQHGVVQQGPSAVGACAGEQVPGDQVEAPGEQRMLRLRRAQSRVGQRLLRHLRVHRLQRSPPPTWNAHITHPQLRDGFLDRPGAQYLRPRRQRSPGGFFRGERRPGIHGLPAVFDPRRGVVPRGVDQEPHARPGGARASPGRRPRPVHRGRGEG